MSISFVSASFFNRKKDLPIPKLKKSKSCVRHCASGHFYRALWIAIRTKIAFGQTDIFQLKITQYKIRPSKFHCSPSLYNDYIFILQLLLNANNIEENITSTYTYVFIQWLNLCDGQLKKKHEKECLIFHIYAKYTKNVHIARVWTRVYIVIYVCFTAQL